MKVLFEIEIFLVVNNYVFDLLDFKHEQEVNLLVKKVIIGIENIFSLNKQRVIDLIHEKNG